MQESPQIVPDFNCPLTDLTLFWRQVCSSDRHMGQSGDRDLVSSLLQRGIGPGEEREMRGIREENEEEESEKGTETHE